MGLFSSIKHDILAFIARCNGNGVIAEDFEARELGIDKVKSISVRGPWCVEIHPADGKNHGRIIIEKRFLDRADFRYGDEAINLSMLEVIGFGPKVMPRLELYLDELPAVVTLSDSAKISAASPMTGKNLLVEARGQAQVDLSGVHLESLKVNLHLHSECRCGGEINIVSAKITHQAKCEFSGSIDDFSAEMCGRSVLTVAQAENAAFRLAEDAEAKIIAVEKLNVSARGIAKLYYAGTPEIIRNISEYAQLIAIK